MRDIVVLLPLIIVGAGAIMLMLLAAFESLSRQGMSIVGMGVFAFAFVVQLAVDNSAHFLPFATLFNGMMVASTATKVSGLIILGCGFFSLVAAQAYYNRNHGFVLEFYALMLFAAFGMILVTMAAELITLLIALEIMSLAVYTLVGSDRKSVVRAEAVLKYLLLGAFAGSFLVMGTVFIYGAAQSTHLLSIAATISDTGIARNPPMMVGILLIIVALLFKVAAFPFHAWVVDVYDGAPLPITAYMATGVKTAAFMVLLQVMMLNPVLAASWSTMLFYIAIFTMLAGNLIAIGQHNLKRMLAASGIVHTGYLIIGIMAVSSEGASGGVVLFYLAAYSISTLGIFTVLCYLSGQQEALMSFDDFAGLAKIRPYSAALLTVFLLSMAGIPPTAGFMGKFYIIATTFKAGHMLLAILAIFSSIISLWYYLRLITVMYFKNPLNTFASAEMSIAPVGALLLAITVFAICFYPLAL